MPDRAGARSRARNKKLPACLQRSKRRFCCGVGRSLSTRKGTANERIRVVDEHLEPKLQAGGVSFASQADGARAKIKA